MTLAPFARKPLIVFVLAGLGFGCERSSPTAGPTASEQRKQTLQEVGEMYRMYVASAKKAPTKVDVFKGAQVVAPLGYQAVLGGDIVVQWGVLLEDTSEAGSNDSAEEILAYEKEVPEKGGEVLMKNRMVKTLTAEEFKATPKAGSK